MTGTHEEAEERERQWIRRFARRYDRDNLEDVVWFKVIANRWQRSDMFPSADDAAEAYRAGISVWDFLGLVV